MSDLEVHDVPAGVDPDGWRLDVTGEVTQELSLDSADLDGFPAETFTADFTCVAGWVAEDLAWRGVRVGDVLARAEPTAAASHALVRAMDGEFRVLVGRADADEPQSADPGDVDAPF